MKSKIATALLTMGLLVGGVASAAPAAAAGATCAVRWGSLVKSAPATATGVITGVRTGRHECYDRVVIDISDDAPGYRVEYVTTLEADGSGARLPVSGGATIRVVVIAPAYDDAGRSTVSPTAVDAIRTTGDRTLRDVVWAGSFEGQTTIGIGVRARLPMRVFTLDGPGAGSRLVIDIAHRW